MGNILSLVRVVRDSRTTLQWRYILGRFFINGCIGLVSAIFVLHSGWWAALTLGIATGSMSASFQYGNNSFQAWYKRSKTFLGKYPKKVLVEITFRGILDGVALGFGLHIANYLSAYLSSMAISVTLSIICQSNAATQGFSYYHDIRVVSQIGETKANEKADGISMLASAISVASALLFTGPLYCKLVSACLYIVLYGIAEFYKNKKKRLSLG